MRTPRTVEARRVHPAPRMEAFGHATSSLERLRRERDRLGPTERACVESYLDEVEPCAEALADAARFAAGSAVETLDAVAESIGAFADEIATIVIERHGGDEDLLPDILALARVEREGLAEEVRRLREAPGRGDLSARARLALDALAVSLVAVRRHARRAA